jgi:hypothetical protein
VAQFLSIVPYIAVRVVRISLWAHLEAAVGGGRARTPAHHFVNFLHALSTPAWICASMWSANRCESLNSSEHSWKQNTLQVQPIHAAVSEYQ